MLNGEDASAATANAEAASEDVKDQSVMARPADGGLLAMAREAGSSAHEEELSHGLIEAMQTLDSSDGTRQPPATSSMQPVSTSGDQQGVYHVILDGIDISYDVAASGVASVRTAMPWRRPATQ